jgi:hypothetical protein
VSVDEDHNSIPLAYDSYSRSSAVHMAPGFHQSVSTQTPALPSLLPPIHPSASQSPNDRHPGASVYIEQDQVTRAVSTISDGEDTTTRIGFVLSNGRLMCNHEKCAGRSFARKAELKRHYTTLHAHSKPNFWCPFPACPRSEHRGDNAFHRKDKMTSHVRSMHSTM